MCLLPMGDHHAPDVAQETHESVLYFRGAAPLKLPDGSQSRASRVGHFQLSNSLSTVAPRSVHSALSHDPEDHPACHIPPSRSPSNACGSTRRWPPQRVCELGPCLLVPLASATAPFKRAGFLHCRPCVESTNVKVGHIEVLARETTQGRNSYGGRR